MINYGNPIEGKNKIDDAKVPYAERMISEISLRILGPEVMWGADIRVPDVTVAGMEKLLQEAGRASGHRLPGYIIKEADGSVSCHISRLPRRISLEVPPTSVFVEAVKAAENTIRKNDFQCSVQIERLSDKEEFRVILGLEEGYFEARRKDILKQIDDGALTTADAVREMFQQRIGSPADWKIDLDAAQSLAEIREIIDSVSMSRLHTVEEVLAGLSEQFEVTPCTICSVAPEYTYKEPAVRIIAADNHSNLEAIVRLANAFHQARFSLERLNTGEAFNIEILADSGNAAARFG
jgi:hypothetical protein